MWSFFKKKQQAKSVPEVKQEPKSNELKRALGMIGDKGKADYFRNRYPIQPPQIDPIATGGSPAPVMAMDYQANNYAYNQFFNQYNMVGFPGYPYLAGLATRPEYRAMASAYSVEVTREWIQFCGVNEEEGEAKKTTRRKIKELEDELERLQVRKIIQTAAEHDKLFGRAQILINTGAKEEDLKLPLIVSSKTIKKGSIKGFSNVEPIWSTPAGYNALDPSQPDFYKPLLWFVIGRETHSTRLMTIITNPVPDILKPAFNFGGISLSQLAEPYVDIWLVTRQSIADMINMYSITVLATDMSQVLSGVTNAAGSFLDRLNLFSQTRSNKGIMALDKEREEVIQVNTPLSGLAELQSQAQEHMCAVSRVPAMILTGISPSGLNASSEGEIRAWYDWIAAQQSAYWHAPLKTMIQCAMLNLWGEIDENISFNWVPLWQMSGKELAEIRKSDAEADAVYLTNQVVSIEEVRGKLASDPESGYEGLDVDEIPEAPEVEQSDTPE